MNWAEIGNSAREVILHIAGTFVADFWPGLFSLGLLTTLTLFSLVLFRMNSARTKALNWARSLVEQALSAKGSGIDLARLASSLAQGKTYAAKRIFNSFNEFRETLIVGRGDDMTVKNAIRPSAFLNVEDLGFSLKAWRIWPGLFVSIGLLFTFLGLVAVLTVAANELVGTEGAGVGNEMVVLQKLLGMAAAKFTISLTGLFCSILINLLLNFLSSRIEKRADELCAALERALSYISLEALAEDQLRATRDQSENLRAVVTELVAELGKSIEKAAERSETSVAQMVQGIGANISSGIGDSLERAATRVEEATKSLSGLGASLGNASQQFDSALCKSSEMLTTVLTGLEAVSLRLTAAAESLASTNPQLIETLRAGNAQILQVAEGAAEMVNSAKIAISEEKVVVLDAMRSIEALIRSFEQRAAAYDGQLEKAFQVYQTQVAETIGRLESHGAEVQGRFGEALATLTTVIQNAKAFEPESVPPAAAPLLTGTADT